MRFAAFELVAFDREQLGVGILRILEDRAGGYVASEIDALAVGREGGLAEFLLVLLVDALDQLHARAAVDAVQPHFSSAERASGGEVLLGDDKTAVGAPTRLVEEAE